jgi:hypothetical protein
VVVLKRARIKLNQAIPINTRYAIIKREVNRVGSRCGADTVDSWIGPTSKPVGIRNNEAVEKR